VVLGLATVVTATLGDLSESLLKRDLELKDMGRLVPGTAACSTGSTPSS
jgi:phosphatidate cytidylyltransferase